MSAGLAPALVENVLERLGFSGAPPATHAGLAAVYGAWCRAVPFDNIRKLVHVRSADPGPLPGDAPNEFFEAWLRHGTGGTCWAANGALCELLAVLGFDARRAAATMMVAPGLPPNHGSVVVHLDEPWIVDASMLFVEPLALRAGAHVAHPPWGVHARFVDGRFNVRWNALQRPQPVDCRFDRFGVTVDDFRAFHEATRAWSPFNFELNLSVVRDDGRLGVALGHAVWVDARGEATRAPIAGESRVRFLVEEVGISEDMASRVPPDVATPPPPGSRTAAAQEA